MQRNPIGQQRSGSSGTGREARHEDEEMLVASSSGPRGTRANDRGTHPSREPAPIRKAPSQGEVLLQEFKMKQIQNMRATDSSRPKDPLENLAEISMRLGANSGMIKGPMRANLTNPNSTHNVARHTATSIMRFPTSTRNQITSNPITLVAKESKKPTLPWEDQDEARENRLRANKRSRDTGGLGEYDEPIARSARMQPRTAAARPLREADRAVQRPPKSFLSPQLSLRKDGASDSDPSASVSGSDDEMSVDEPVARTPPVAQAGRAKTAFRKVATPLTFHKAARKTDATSTDSDSGTESNDTSSRSEDSEVDSDAQREPLIVKLEEASAPRLIGPAELVVVDSPPQITIPLPQIGPEHSQNTTTPFPPSLIAALERLTLSCSYLHQTRQLPFLLRNIRRGFLLRCKALDVPLVPERQNISIHVRYDHVDDIHHEITLDAWRCPICSLHDCLPNQQVLQKHLAWDHAECFVEWNLQYNNSWTLKILVPQPDPNDSQKQSNAVEGSVEKETTPPPQLPLDVPSVPLPEALTNRRDTLFPFVVLSPPSSPEPSPPPEVIPLPPVSPTPETSTSPAPALSPTPSSVVKGKQPMYPLSLPSTSSRFGSSSTALSSTIASSTTARTTATTPRMLASEFVGPDGRQYPAPPPPEDPLGPAARPPYFPAEPDYPNGQTVYYSCRPGGPSVCDLLNTLSMEPFGVLDWAVLDREEEIFESDEALKDEHKVMHALWARWILLNRRKFIADFHKGVQAFVDEYWKMIHRAAGWEALRYWLILLLANRFLTAKEVATTLKHYEGLTGMDHWYE